MELFYVNNREAFFQTYVINMEIDTPCSSNMSHSDHTTTANPDIKVHGANVGPIWGRQDPGCPRVGPKTFLSGKQPY